MRYVAILLVLVLQKRGVLSGGDDDFEDWIEEICGPDYLKKDVIYGVEIGVGKYFKSWGTCTRDNTCHHDCSKSEHRRMSEVAEDALKRELLVTGASASYSEVCPEPIRSRRGLNVANMDDTETLLADQPPNDTIKSFHELSAIQLGQLIATEITPKDEDGSEMEKMSRRGRTGLLRYSHTRSLSHQGKFTVFIGELFGNSSLMHRCSRYE